jgi:hypothetical protein
VQELPCDLNPRFQTRLVIGTPLVSPYYFKVVAIVRVHSDNDRETDRRSRGSSACSVYLMCVGSLALCWKYSYLEFRLKSTSLTKCFIIISTPQGSVRDRLSPFSTCTLTNLQEDRVEIQMVM